MNLRLIGRSLCIAGLIAVFSACAPLPPPQQANSPGFAVRPPLPGHPGYNETIKYIDDGLRYVDPNAGFMVSPDGRMCFLGVFDPRQTAFEALIFKNNYCLAPTAVGRVDAFESIDGQQLRLVCNHANPQCVRDIGFPNYEADAVVVQIVPSSEEKAAVENLIYLMGGNLTGQPGL